MVILTEEKKEFIMAKKNSKQLRKETKIKLKKIGRRNRKFVHIVCTKCGKTIDIMINLSSIDLYTKEMRKHYICLLCR